MKKTPFFMSVKHALYLRYYPYLRRAVEQWRLNWFTYCLLLLVLVAIFRKHQLHLQGLWPSKTGTQQHDAKADTRAESMGFGATQSALIDAAAARAFVQRFSATAASEQRKFGVPTSVILTTALVQSAGGTNLAAMGKNNYFGLLNSSGQLVKYKTAWDSFRAFSMAMQTVRGQTNGSKLSHADWVRLIQESGICAQDADFAAKMHEAARYVEE